MLEQAPASLCTVDGTPRFGTYQGTVAKVDYSALSGAFALSLPARLAKHKRWNYAQVCTPEVVVLAAIVDLGYSANAFVVAVDLETNRALLDKSFLGLPPLVRVNDAPGEG